MNNSLMENLKSANNYALTENCGLTHRTTNSKVYDLFALGGSYRKRTDEDCILLFKNALEEDEVLALKCLFYLRDCRGGQGERRFFRVCYKWLANKHPEVAARNLDKIPLFGRYDDLYCLEGTPLENEMFAFIKSEIAGGLEVLESIKE
jgi:hypothetical protein